MKSSLIVIFMTMIVILQGCSSQTTKVDQQLVVGAQLNKNKEIQAALIQAVAKTSLALSSLSEIRRAQYPHQKVMPFINIHDKRLNQKISVNWYGPIGSIVNNIAKAVDFQYQEFGKQPSLPVLVNIDYKSIPAITALQNIELQANNKASIKILPKQKIISLRYLVDD